MGGKIIPKQITLNVPDNAEQFSVIYTFHKPDGSLAAGEVSNLPPEVDACILDQVLTALVKRFALRKIHKPEGDYWIITNGTDPN